MLLCGLAVSLTLSVFATSVFQILMAINWLAEGQLAGKFRSLLRKKSLLLVLSLYVVFLLGFLNSANYVSGLHDLRIKLPLLVLPLIIGTSGSLSHRQVRMILLFFTAGLLVNTFVSSAILFGLVNHPISDIRQISVFIDHIRFSLMIDIGIFSLAWMLSERDNEMGSRVKLLLAIALCWLIIFQFLLRSYSGILIFFITGFFLFLANMNRIRNPLLRWFVFLMVMTIPLLCISYIGKAVERFYTIERVDPGSLEEFTVNGNRYSHDTTNKQVENGKYIWLYVCQEELRKEWNRISTTDFDGHDRKGQEIRYTLIRYLTSKGFRKDSVGVNSLKQDDIEAIENGKANCLYKNRMRIYPNLYEIIWQIDVFRKGGNPSGHSVTQRILYAKAAMTIISDHLLFGVGNGDLQDAYTEYYRQTGSRLTEKWRLRAHNQYLTFMATYGLIGFAWIMAALFVPVFLEKRWGDYYFLMFFLVGFLSMLDEDTLETRMMRSLEQGFMPDSPDAAKQAIAQRIPMQRYGSAEEVADLMLFLAGDASRYITGGICTVDGGMSCQ